MSSILEALRELESNRPGAPKPAIPIGEPDRDETSRVAEWLIPVIGGLAVGVVAFGLWVFGPFHPPAPTPASDGPPTAGAAPDRPAWLDAAEAPRARVSSGAAGVPERPAIRDVQPAHRAALPPLVDDAPPERAEAPPPRTAGRVELDSIAFSPNVAERAATLRLDGRRVTLRQRESAGGVEVQLIMPNAVYVRRGADVFLVEPGR